MKRYYLVLLVAGALSAPAFGDTELLNETFDDYADDDALMAQWVGASPADFRLVDASIHPDAFPDGGKGAEHIGGVVADWAGFGSLGTISPSESQYILIQGDVYDDGLGNPANKRMTIGLRSNSPANILELGFYNSNSCDPTVCGPGEAGGTSAPQNAVDGDPGFYQGTTYGYRTQLFGGITEPLLVQPDWQYFQLPQELDRPAGDPPEPDGLINTFDVGPGWHQYRAIIRPDSITLEIDLFRDNLRNTSITPDEEGVRPGTPGVDASVTWPVITHEAGFDSLRIGGPSSLGSAGGGLLYDNIILAMIDAVAPELPGDFNGNGAVENADLTLLLNNWGNEVPPVPEGWIGHQPTAPAVDNDELTALLNNWGASNLGSGQFSSTTVPEPATVSLVVLALVSLVGLARRRGR